MILTECVEAIGFAVAKNAVFGSNVTGYDPVVYFPSCSTDSNATCFLGSSTGSSSMQKMPCFACRSCPGEYESILNISTPFFATLIASMYPTRSLTEISGGAKTYRNLSAPSTQLILVSSLLSRIFCELSGL